MAPRVSSEQSALTKIFLERVGTPSGSSDHAVLELVKQLRKSAKAKLGEVPFDRYLELRNILSISYLRDLGHDGQIEPIGNTWEGGFRVLMNRSTSATRSRFTLAHELCHTFFYELVPEIKFLPQPIDPAEERLCNLGAAELLMPAKLVIREAKGQPVSLCTLERLAAFFRVSVEAMASRLIHLKLWQVELSFWSRMSNGKFAMERVVGSSIRDWDWSDRSQLEEAWISGRPAAGRQLLTRHDDRGTRQVLLTRFDLARRHNQVCVLWGKGVVGAVSGSESLFSKPKPANGNLAGCPISL